MGHRCPGSRSTDEAREQREETPGVCLHGPRCCCRKRPGTLFPDRRRRDRHRPTERSTGPSSGPSRGSTPTPPISSRTSSISTTCISAMRDSTGRDRALHRRPPEPCPLVCAEESPSRFLPAALRCPAEQARNGFSRISPTSWQPSSPATISAHEAMMTRRSSLPCG